MRALPVLRLTACRSPLSATMTRPLRPDLADLRSYHDYRGSVEEQRLWEQLRRRCGARRGARRAQAASTLASALCRP